ncbi:hypothetical protein SLA2020_438530 [Shorea laevis]
MSYIPPHKRQSKDHDRPSQIPESLPRQFRRNLDLSSSKSNKERSGKIVYAEKAISTWFAVVEDEQVGKPWVSLAENVLPNLLSAFENVRSEMVCQKLVNVKPTLVARFGKILFHGSPSNAQETTAIGLAAEIASRKLKRSFYTNVPNSYMENIMGKLPERLKLFLKRRKIYTICVTWSWTYRALIKVSDLRLMLYTKGVLTLTDDEMESIRNLINSAVLDPVVKGGLRWPLGYASSGNRFCVVGVWHTIAKAYKNPSMRLKVRHADRFDFRTSTGEASREISLKLKSIISLLQEQTVENSSVSEMLKDTLRLIWDLSSGEGFLT